MEFITQSQMAGFDNKSWWYTDWGRQTAESIDIGVLTYLVVRYGPPSAMYKALVGGIAWHIYQGLAKGKDYQVGNVRYVAPTP